MARVWEGYIVIRKLVNENKEEAIRKTKEMEDKHEKSMILCTIAEALITFYVQNCFCNSNCRKNGGGIKIASNIGESSERVYAMIRISHLLEDRNEIEEARRILEKTTRIIDEVQDDISKIISIKRVACAFVNIGEIDKAWNLIEHAKMWQKNLKKRMHPLPIYQLPNL